MSEMKPNMSKPVLLLVDYQQAFLDLAYWGQRNNPLAEANAARILAVFRNAGLPIIHLRHNSTNPTSSLRPGQAGNDALAFAQAREGEPVLGKCVNSGFIGTDLETRLQAMGAKHLVIMGISTDHCVSTTTRMAANLGFNVTLVGDACFTFERTGLDGAKIPADQVHHVELTIPSGEFAQVVSTQNWIDAFKALD